jgi:hypothetical protein
MAIWTKTKAVWAIIKDKVGYNFVIQKHLK